ncbi:hypothetical protein L3Q82_017993, partial [Scortum barcoo]
MWLITSRRAPSVPGVRRRGRQARMGLLQPLPVPQRPWSHLMLDFITGLPPSKGVSGSRRLAEVRSLSLFFGRSSATLLGMAHRQPASSGYHLESNGQTERMNQELETCLRCLVAQNQTTCRLLGATVSLSSGTLRPNGQTERMEPDTWRPACDALGYRSIGSCSGQEKRSHKIWEAGHGKGLHVKVPIKNDRAEPEHINMPESCFQHVKGQARMKAAADRGHLAGQKVPAYQKTRPLHVWLSTKDLCRHYTSIPENCRP